MLILPHDAIDDVCLHSMLVDEVKCLLQRLSTLPHIISDRKMSSHDLVRVFKGVGLVVDHLVVMNKYGLREKITRAQFHVSELMKVGYEIGGDMSSTEVKSHTDESHRTGHHGDQKHDHYASSSVVHPTTSASATPYVPPFVTTPKEASSANIAAAVPFMPPFVTTPKDSSSANLAANSVAYLKPAPLADPVAVAPLTAESFIAVPISIDDFKSINSQSVDKAATQSSSEDLIGFDPRIKKATPSKVNETGVRDGNTVVNGVRTSSMRERAVPATQLVRPLMNFMNQ